MAFNIITNWYSLESFERDGVIVLTYGKADYEKFELVVVTVFLFEQDHLKQLTFTFYCVARTTDGIEL